MTALLDVLIPPRRTAPPVKASSGIGSTWMTYEMPVSSFSRNPQKAMRDAQSLYRLNPWVGAAERLIGQRFATVGWHIEDADDNEIDDTSPAPYQAIRNLLERPYTPRPGDPQSQTPRTRSSLWKITCRHMGLCGVTFWYLDQTEALGGTPLQILYLNPARVTPKTDAQGNLTDWLLDADDRGYGGTPLGLKNVVRFQLEPPDEGHLGVGLVESAMAKVEVSRLADRHSVNVLAAGGKQGGVISPHGGRLNDDEYAQLERDVRTMNEGPDAARRWLILRGPVDYTRTASTPMELNLLELAQMAKEDTLALWGVPPSQLGITLPVGMNSGGAKDTDFEVLWQNGVGPRLRVFRETLQFEFLDRYKTLGLQPELEIDEPQFDDKYPQFELAGQAANQPLRNKERRALMGLDPFGDDALDNAVWMPTNVIAIGQAPDEETGVIAPPPYLDELRHQAAVSEPGAGVVPAAPAFGGGIGKAKADVRDETALRMKADLVRVLKRAGVNAAAKATQRHGHLTRKPSDVDAIFDARTFEATLSATLRPYAASIADHAKSRARTLVTGKARADTVLDKLLAQIGIRVKGITETTREDLIRVVKQGMADGLSPAQLGDLIEQSTTFDELRAETIARTETGTYLNLAAGQAYRDFGLDKVLVIDGEGDDICARVDGQVWTLDELDANPLGHPNCTRDFSPLLPGDVSA